MDPPHRPPSGGREEDRQPMPDPPSPLGFQRPHAQPAQIRVEEDTFLRRRHARQDSQAGPSHVESTTHVDGVRDEDMVSIRIATPYNEVDSKRRDAQLVPRTRTVGEIKDEIAAAKWDGDDWERDRMRLVWQGRIIADEELVGDVVGSRDIDQTHTLHLVARRRPSSQRPMPLPLPQFAPVPHTPQPSASSRPTVKPQDRISRALQDTVHYVLFLARRHLCLFVGHNPLKWEDTIPPPVVEEAMARSAVMSVVRAIASDQGEGVWRECEKAFEEDAEVVWDVLGRSGVEEELKLMWKTTLGKYFTPGTRGEIVIVEFDGIPQELNIPPIPSLSLQQLCRLLQYLRVVALLPCLNHLLEQSAVPAPNPTPTTVRVQVPPPGPGVREIYRLQLHLQLPTISLALLSHIVFSAIKICAMLWMLSQGMKRTDVRLWIIVGGAVGWWIGDVMYEVRQERARRRPPPTAPAAGLALPGGAVPAVGADGQPNAGAPNAPQDWRMPGRVRPGNQGAVQVLTQSLPLLHLDTDAQQLHLNGQPARTPLRRPPRILTQFLLPAALWFITLIPEWETLRARAIRRRERSMRVLVGEMSAAPSPVTETAPLPPIDGALEDNDDSDNPSEETPNGEAARDSERQAFANGLGADLRRNVIRVYPLGLNAVAKRYYERMMDRGEGIDWEEEREAQRAMGIGEEEERDQGGMRMGML